MKKIILIAIFSLLLTTTIFPQTTGETETALPEPMPVTGFHKNSVILGLNFGIGFATPLIKIIPDSHTSATPFISTSGRFMLFFADTLGLQFDLGINYLKLKETLSSSNIFAEYDLIYISLSSAPFFRYRRFFITMGFYTGILIFAKTDTSSGSSKSIKSFNRLDFGLTFGIGFILGNPAKRLYSIGFDVKYQLSDFKKNEINGSQILSFYLNFGILFNSSNALR